MPGPAPVREDGTPVVFGPERDDEDDDIEDVRPRWATIAANICFAISASAVLFGIYLIVPAFHR